MAQQDPSHTLQPTALVNELWLKFVKANNCTFESRAKFFGFAARVMRNILVEHARRKCAEFRGGGRKPENIDETDVAGVSKAEELLDLDEALKLYAMRDPEKANLIELHYFGGLTIAEVASTVGRSLETVKRHLKAAKANLRLEIQELRK